MLCASPCFAATSIVCPRLWQARRYGHPRRCRDAKQMRVRVMTFEDRIVLVTGGTSGIGLACAALFAQRGARVVIAGRDVSRGKKVEKDFLNKGWTCEFIRADLA